MRWNSAVRNRRTAGKLRPWCTSRNRMGCLISQLICGPVKEISIEYMGDFKGLDLSPVTTSVIQGR
ncbi:MAG: hypothetical protein R2941_04325 [Desulfobacterales bacterium]